MHKIVLPACLALTVLLTACGSSEVPTADDGSASSTVQEASSVDLGIDSDARVIDVTVKDFAFEPSELHAKQGEKVVIKLQGTEGTHGFAVPDLGINVAVSAGQSVVVNLPTDKAGTFSFLCSIPCGSGHMNMKGTIVID